MFYENELRFLRDTFKKIHIQTNIVSLSDKLSSILPPGLDSLFDTVYSGNEFLYKIIGEVKPCTMYKATDPLSLSYIYFILPEDSKKSILFIGPYNRSRLTSRQLMEIAERFSISPKNQRYLNEYYNSIPILGENSHVFAMLDAFCEHIWRSPSFSIVDTDSEWKTSSSIPIGLSASSEDFDDVLMNMMAMETRYRFENELIQAVSLGQLHKDSMIFSMISDQAIERRNSDPIRNMKNYCIIMNTLSRKAAESGGVHPMHIDKVSTSFALKIEQMTSPAEGVTLMKEMFRSYCRLVRKHSMKGYSLVVQKAIMLIETDLSANLSLSTLASSQNISSGYLSTVFKKETGKTVSEYIREKRVEYAAHLLGTTHLQIQTIALHCGIMDVQYFSKIFKKQTGKTPKEYRESVK
ncbi:MAG: AraC family transcriptional regulator [Ruminococcaceae bacterium]|nr:AraC family transcriptional regulator [Oscillospiraceae bacterium]